MQRKLKDIAKVRAGYPFRGAIEPVRDGEFQLIQIKDIKAGNSISFDDLVRVNPDRVKSDHMIHQGEILFVARGNRSQAIVINEELRNTIFGLQFFAVELGDNTLSSYLAWYINQRPAQQYFDENAVGSNVKLITKTVLEDLPIEIPALELQHKIAHLYELSRKEFQLLEQIKAKRQQLIEGALMKAIHTNK